MDPSAWLGMFTSGWSEIGSAAFWVALLQIMWINILLSGDNAVVIAMACRGLPHRQRLWGMILGAGVAVLLRVVFTVFVAALMLVWAGAALLGWIVGEVIATDPVIHGYLKPRLGPDGFHYVMLFAALLGAILVLIVGGLWRRSKLAEHAEKVRAAQ